MFSSVYTYAGATKHCILFKTHACFESSCLFKGSWADQPCKHSVLQCSTKQEYWLLQVAVAQQIYDYVDQRIRRLDKDLKAFDAELTKDRLRQGLPVCSYPDPSLIIFTCCALQSGNYTLQLVCPHAQLCCRYHHIALLLSYAFMGFSTHSGAQVVEFASSRLTRLCKAQIISNCVSLNADAWGHVCLVPHSMIFPESKYICQRTCKHKSGGTLAVNKCHVSRLYQLAIIPTHTLCCKSFQQWLVERRMTIQMQRRLRWSQVFLTSKETSRRRRVGKLLLQCRALLKLVRYAHSSVPHTEACGHAQHVPSSALCMHVDVCNLTT